MLRHRAPYQARPTRAALSARETKVLFLSCKGPAIQEMAVRLLLSPHTVRDHVKHVLAKVGVDNRSELVAKLFVEQYQVSFSARRL